MEGGFRTAGKASEGYGSIAKVLLMARCWMWGGE